MFTGLIQKKGRLTGREKSGSAGKLVVSTDEPFENLQHGESIAVNGACLTLENFNNNTLTFHVLSETLSKTNLGSLPLESGVNLERALAAGERLGGHIVSGHIDCTSTVKSWSSENEDSVLSVYLPETLTPYAVEKGSIAIDGISLTIASITDDSFSVHLIPTTLNETCLGERTEGSAVNLEVDMIGKYVAKQLSAYLPENQLNNKITMKTLAESGW